MNHTLKQNPEEYKVLFGQELTERQLDELMNGKPIHLENVVQDGENLVGAKITLTEQGELAINPDYLSLEKTKETFSLTDAQLKELQETGITVAKSTDDYFVLTYDQDNKVVIPESYTELNIPQRVEGVRLSDAERELLALGKDVENFKYSNELMQVTCTINMREGEVVINQPSVNLTDKGLFENKLLASHQKLDFDGIASSVKQLEHYIPSPTLQRSIMNDNVSNDHKLKSLNAIGVTNASTVLQDHNMLQQAKATRERERKARKQEVKQKVKKANSTLTGFVDKGMNTMRFG